MFETLRAFFTMSDEPDPVVSVLPSTTALCAKCAQRTKAMAHFSIEADAEVPSRCELCAGPGPLTWFRATPEEVYHRIDED